MSTNRPIDDVVRDWLHASAPPRSADVVVDNVLAALPAIDQESDSGTARAFRTVRSAALMAAVFIFAAVAATVISRPDGLPGSEPSASPTASPSPSATSSATALPAGVVAAIDMQKDTWALAVDEASVWVQVGDVGIQRIDRATNTNTGIFVSEVPQMVFDGPNLWALDVGTGIVRLDPLTGAILQTLPGISGFYIATDGDTAWVSDVGHSLDRVDLTTGEVVATIDVPAGPKEIAIFEGSVWVTCDGGGVVARVDIATNTVVSEIPAGNRPVNLAVGEGAVWVWNHEQQLLRVDPATNEVAATIPGVAETLGVGVAVGGGYVWVAVPTGIGQIDPATNEIVQVIPLGPGNWIDLEWFDGELWASSVERKLVYRIDPTLLPGPGASP